MNVLACGALANELVTLKRLNGWTSLSITCLPAHYHQTPDKIPSAVESAIEKIRRDNDEDILIAYGDCGTGGKLDKIIQKAGAGVQRLPGAHCYEFFAGSQTFAELHETEIGTFYLTDFLTAHFDTYVWQALGLDKKPELLQMYFAHYKKLVYLAQTQSADLRKQALTHAQTLGLAFEYRFTEYGELERKLSNTMHIAPPTLNPCPV